MTKKSLNHQMRDKKNKELKQTEEIVADVSWKELNEIYRVSNNALAAVLDVEGISNDVMPYVENKEQLLTVVDQLKNDVTALSAELNAIYYNHKDREDQCDLNNIMEFFSVAQAYESWGLRFETVLAPTHDTFIDIIYQADLARAEQEGADVSTVRKMPNLHTFTH